MEVHLGIEIGPSQYGVKDHIMVMKPIKVNPLWYQMKVQNVSNPLENVVGIHEQQ